MFLNPVFETFPFLFPRSIEAGGNGRFIRNILLKVEADKLSFILEEVIFLVASADYAIKSLLTFRYFDSENLFPVPFSLILFRRSGLVFFSLLLFFRGL